MGLPTSRVRARARRLIPTDRCPRDSNPGPLDLKSSILPLSYRPPRKVLLRPVPLPGPLRSSYTMRTKCAISDSFVRDCVFAYCASVTQYVFSLSAEYCFRLRNNAISDERARDCALSTHSVFRPLVAAGMTRLSSPRAPTSRSSNAGDPAVDRRLPLRLLDSSARPRTQPRVTGCRSRSSIPQRRNQL